LAVADRIGSASLLESARSAFAHGMDIAMLVSACIALVGCVLSLLLLPRTNDPKATMAADDEMEAEFVGTG
jgi:hypothetical protein